MRSILVTWATWYLGSHMRVELLEQGYTVVWVDTCERSNKEIIQRVEEISWKDVSFYQCCISDTDTVADLMKEHSVDCVIHFAAYKAVWESCMKPVVYFENNISGTISLLSAMHKSWVNQLIFSSSATVYDGKFPAPYSEVSPIGAPSNPYGATKYQCELLLDTYCQHSDLSALSLRYFNPVGAHPSRKLWEDIQCSDKSLQALVMKTLLGEREKLAVFGSDRPTPDGSCLRDYISVNDLIRWHSAALDFLKKSIGQMRNEKINLWTGQWVSVLDFLHAVEEWTWLSVPYEVTERRQWDLWVVYADVEKAKELLWWEARDSLSETIKNEREFVKNYWLNM